jgi:hypothetical protein
MQTNYRVRTIMKTSPAALLRNDEPSSQPSSQPSGLPSEANALPLIKQASDEELQNECSRICHNQSLLDHDATERELIALQLASYLLAQNDINFIWAFRGSSYVGKASLVDYLSFLDVNTIVSLAERGLDFNPIMHSGVAKFTFIIGNASNSHANFLLDVAGQYQTPEQRAVWINKKDEMVRFEEPACSLSCWGLFSASGRVTPVHQTPLQLTIAKGYEHADGAGNDVRVSNLCLASKLLQLGAIDEIDYQEPAKGNTALHMACARRDVQAIMLLIGSGASVVLRNHDNRSPTDMFDLSFKEVGRLLEFHTSPDGHPNTFCLDKEAFNDSQNLAVLRELALEVDAQVPNRI